MINNTLKINKNKKTINSAGDFSTGVLEAFLAGRKQKIFKNAVDKLKNCKKSLQRLALFKYISKL
jgi:hypothetical protein